MSERDVPTPFALARASDPIRVRDTLSDPPPRRPAQRGVTGPSTRSVRLRPDLKRDQRQPNDVAQLAETSRPDGLDWARLKP